MYINKSIIKIIIIIIIIIINIIIIIFVLWFKSKTWPQNYQDI